MKKLLPGINTIILLFSNQNWRLVGAQDEALLLNVEVYFLKQQWKKVLAINYLMCDQGDDRNVALIHEQRMELSQMA